MELESERKKIGLNGNVRDVVLSIALLIEKMKTEDKIKHKLEECKRIRNDEYSYGWCPVFEIDMTTCQECNIPIALKWLLEKEKEI